MAVVITITITCDGCGGMLLIETFTELYSRRKSKNDPWFVRGVRVLAHRYDCDWRA